MSVAATQMQMQLVHGGRPNWQMVRAIVLSCHIGFVVVMGGAQGALMMVDAACCSAEPTHFVSLFHVSARQLNIQLYRTHLHGLQLADTRILRSAVQYLLSTTYETRIV